MERLIIWGYVLWAARAQVVELQKLELRQLQLAAASGRLQNHLVQASSEQLDGARGGQLDESRAPREAGRIVAVLVQDPGPVHPDRLDQFVAERLDELHRLALRVQQARQQCTRAGGRESQAIQAATVGAIVTRVVDGPLLVGHGARRALVIVTRLVGVSLQMAPGVAHRRPAPLVLEVHLIEGRAVRQTTTSIGTIVLAIGIIVDVIFISVRVQLLVQDPTTTPEEIGIRVAGHGDH